MAKHTAKEWLGATRYWSFPVSTMPVLATAAYLFSQGLLPGGIRPILLLLLTLAGAVILHSAGNLLSDWADYRKGVDSERAYAVDNLVKHRFEPEEYLRFSIILFCIGAAIGIALSLLCGLPVLWIGLAGVVLTALYSVLKYNALGDLDIFVIFGILIVLGTTCVFCGTPQTQALILSLPIGIITVSVLHANNTIDIYTDKEAGIRTFAMILGEKTAVGLYQVYLFIPFLCVILYVILGLLHPMSLLCLLAFVPALKNIRHARRYYNEGLQALPGLDQETAKLQLVFSGLFSIGMFVGGLL
ncbi:MAG: prenyltransferase [Bacteroidales bacterium]|nr:prenyltransferase [Bacteroidales bacterium]